MTARLRSRPGSICLFVLLAALPGGASEPDDEDPVRIPDQAAPVYREVRSIPYPSGALYTSRGLSGSFLGGKHRNMGDDQSLYQWQGEIAYFYTRYFSAGVGFKVTAGEPNDTKQKIFNHYFLQARFHKAWSQAAIYVGPQIGVENLNVLTGAPRDSVIQRSIDDTKPGLSLDFGSGWKFTRWVGLTMGSSMDYSLVGEGNAAKYALNFRVLPGFALDVLAFTDDLRELVPAMYVTAEFQSGFLVFEKSRHQRDQAWILGVGLAF